MVDKRLNTTLAYKTDTKGIKDLGKALKDAINIRAIRDMGRAYRDADRELRTLRKTHVELSRELLKVKDGTKEFKLLAKAVEDTERKMGRLKRMMENARPGAGGFTQGFLQGVGPTGAGFLMRGEGMRAQFAGQMVGQGMRRGIGGAVSRGVGAAFTPSGLGALTSGIPVIGGLAQMALGAVGSAREREQAQLQALMTAGAFTGFRDLPANDAARIKAAGDKAARKATSMAFEATLSRNVELELGPGVHLPAEIDATTAKLRAEAEANRARVLAMGGKAREMRANMRQAAEDTARAELKAERKQIRAENARNVRKRFDAAAGVGRRFGMTRTQAIQQAGQFGAMIGGGIPGEEIMGAVLGSQLQGVNTQTAAQFIRQTRRGRGGLQGNAVNQLAGAIGKAVSLGLEGSEVNENLAMIAQLQASAEQRGIKLSAEGFGALAQGFGALGAQGPQAARLAQQFAGFGQRVAAGGAQSPVSVALLRAAGFRPGAGAGNYVDALQRVEQLGEGGLGPRELQGFLQNLVGGVQGEAQRSLVIRRALGSAGVQVGFGQARELQAALGSGDFAGRLAQIQGLEQLTGGQAATGKELLARVKGGGLASQTELARLNALTQDKLVAVGQKLAGPVGRMENNVAKLADGTADLLTPLARLIPAVEDISRRLVDLMGDGGKKLDLTLAAALGQAQ